MAPSSSTHIDEILHAAAISGAAAVRPVVRPVSWASIATGASAAASLSLVLLILGVGLGLSTASPWAGEGDSGTTYGLSTILWLTVTQLLASALGGYLTDRMRPK